MLIYTDYIPLWKKIRIALVVKQHETTDIVFSWFLGHVGSLGVCKLIVLE